MALPSVQNLNYSLGGNRYSSLAADSSHLTFQSSNQDLIPKLLHGPAHAHFHFTLPTYLVPNSIKRYYHSIPLRCEPYNRPILRASTSNQCIMTDINGVGGG
jgi:hypothetical protein